MGNLSPESSLIRRLQREAQERESDADPYKGLKTQQSGFDLQAWFDSAEAKNAERKG